MNVEGCDSADVARELEDDGDLLLITLYRYM